MTEKINNSCSFGRSQRGKGGQQGGVKYSIQSFKWKPTTCAKTTNSAIARNTSSNHLRLQKADGPSFSSKQSSHETKPNNKKLLFLTCLSYGDFRFVSCSVAFVSRHTNPFDDAQVIISSTVLAGSTFHHAAGGSLCVGRVWFLVLFAFVSVLLSFSFGIVMAPLDCVLVLQQHGLLDEFPTALISMQ